MKKTGVFHEKNVGFLMKKAGVFDDKNGGFFFVTGREGLQLEAQLTSTSNPSAALSYECW